MKAMLFTACVLLALIAGRMTAPSVDSKYDLMRIFSTSNHGHQAIVSLPNGVTVNCTVMGTWAFQPNSSTRRRK